VNKLVNSYSFLLGCWLLLASSFSLLDYADLGYFHSVNELHIFTYLLLITCLVFFFSYGYDSLGPRVRFQPKLAIHSEFFIFPFIIIPGCMLLMLVSFALLTYDRGIPTDAQAYFDITDNVTGKVLIHLLPMGLSWHVFNKRKIDRIAAFFIILSISYVLLYTERLYAIQILSAVFIGLQCSGSFELSIKKLLCVTVIAIILFVLSELSRSFLAVRILRGEFSFFEAIFYALRRFFIYYADTALKSAEFFAQSISEGGNASSRYDWETRTLTNRGAIWGLLNYLGLIPAMLSAAFLMVVSGVVLFCAKSGNIYFVPVAPIFFSMIFEFVRVDFFSFSRFWVPLVAYILYLMFISVFSKSPNINR